MSIADKQWARPTAASLQALGSSYGKVIEQAIKDGLSSQPRDWMADEAYLATIPQIQAFRATGHQVYLDRATRELIAYLKRLQQSNGLFLHAATAPFHWGRANGWAAAGMTEILRTLPNGHHHRKFILDRYQLMMAALVRHQDRTGLWRQLLDHEDAWLESSCTGMFVFALVTGIRSGWLPPGMYSEAARCGWLGLAQRINADGDLDGISEGTHISTDCRYYLRRKRCVGDLHGQAAVLWSISAFHR